MPKRRRPAEANHRSSSRNSSNNKNNKAAVPMPDPPTSLVKLLQKDPQVLQYFKSLQTNLNHDVQRWKETALDYKKKYEHLLGNHDKSKSSRPIVKKMNQGERRKRRQDNHDLQHGEEDHRDETKNIGIDDGGDDNNDDPNDNYNDSEAFDKDFFAALPSDDASSSSSSSSSSSIVYNSSISSKSLESLSESRHSKRVKDEGAKAGAVIRKGQKIELMHVKIPAKRLDHDHDDNRQRVSELQEMSSMQREEWKRLVVQDLSLVLNHLKRLGVSVVDIEKKKKHDVSCGTDTTAVDPVAAASSTAVSSASPCSYSIQDVETSRCLPLSDSGKEEMYVDNNDSESDSSNNGFLNSEKLAPPMDDSIMKQNINATDSSSLNKEVTKLVIRRRCDEDIILDLMRSLRSLIRLPTTLASQRGGDFTMTSEMKLKFQPFPTIDLIPACYGSEDSCNEKVDCEVATKSLIHPLVEGLNILIESLIVMDKVCSTDVAYFSGLDEGWLAVGDDALTMRQDDDNMEEMETMESIRIGLASRNISNMILVSLSGEITKQWTALDRAVRGDVQPSSEDIFGKESDGSSDTEDDTKSDTGMGESENEDCVRNVLTFNSKNQNKLFVLLERICLASIVSCIYQSRRDYSSAAQVVIDYIFGALPALGIEDHTSQAPVLSFLVLEALLKPLSNDHIFWFSQTLSGLDDDERILYNTLSYVLHSVAEIWKQRERSSNSKICGISPTEVNAYMRLLESQKDWLSTSIDTISHVTILADQIRDFPASGSVGKIIALQLMLFWNGDLEKAKIFVETACHLCEKCRGQIIHVFALMASAVSSYVRLQQLHWETRCLSGLSISLVKNLTDDDKWLHAQFDNMFLTFSQKSTDSNLSEDVEKLKLLCRWCTIMGDGARAFDLARFICTHDVTPKVNAMRALSLAADFPVVRVVNLKGREDRWKQFITQAQKSQLLVILAVASMSNDIQDTPYSSLWGYHAHDGRDVGHLTFEQQVSKFLEKGKRLGDYVTTHWRPSDLRPFDIHARTDDSLVRASVSERACALSHISSWYGVKNSISDNDFMPDRERMLQLFRISGFACGDPFLKENKGMPPSPVCVILEDDAMLVDQFHDRLAKILQELPRDFHFCSLGYSRPKNAPMIHYSKSLGIPTCFWYLTGYILSLEGAKYLINSLPVQGPVDSWIGMKATANWENEYGRLIGVGTAPKAKVHAEELTFKRKLGDIVKFRVFAALSPLCSQKLAWKEDLSGAKKHEEISKWRHRDTDITFSGRQ